MVIWRVLHWERVHLEMDDLILDPPMLGHMGVEIAILKDFHWESSYVVQKQELR